MINVEQFLKSVRPPEAKSEDVCTLGTVPATYTTGRPTIIFDGESVASTKSYPYLSPYVPAANHRVLLIRSGHTWVVLGRVL